MLCLIAWFPGWKSGYTTDTVPLSLMVTCSLKDDFPVTYLELIFDITFQKTRLSYAWSEATAEPLETSHHKLNC